MTERELDAIVAGILAAVRQHVAEQLDPLRHRLDALEGARSATKPRVTHRGPWTPERGYAPGDGVLHNNVLWRALRTTMAEPGGGVDDAWRRLG